MNSNLTEIAVVLDKSGSMDVIRTDTIGSFNRFLQDQKQLPGQARFTLVLFDHVYRFEQQGAPLSEARELNEHTYVPGGTTALLDAVGRTIDDIGQRLADTPEEERPGKVVIAILTDGMENASKDYTQTKVAELIKHQQEKYQWDFIFLGANMDAVQVATSLNIPAVMALNFSPSSSGIKSAFTQMSSRVAVSRTQK